MAAADGSGTKVLELDARGIAEIESKLKVLMTMARGAVDAALYEEGLAIDRLAVLNTPVDTGRLRSSHYVTPPVNLGDLRTIVEIGFGTEYAVPVHERTEIVRLKPLKPGQFGPQEQSRQGAKYLERAMNERAPGFAQRLVARAERNIRTGRSVTALSSSTPTSPGLVYGPTRETKVLGERVQRKLRKAKAREAQRLARARQRAQPRDFDF